MALSRFSVLPDQHVINTYTPENLAYLNQAMAGRQQAYDQGEATLARGEEMLLGQKVINQDVADKNLRVKAFTSQAQDLVKTKYGGDYGAAAPELRNLARVAAGDEWWQRAGRHYELQQEADKKKATFKTSPLTWNNSLYEQKTQNADGSFNNLSYNGEEQLDWDKKRKDVVGQIEADSGVGNLSQTGAAGILSAVKSKGVDAKKLLTIVDANVNNYLNSAEGRQEVHTILQRNPNATPKELKDYARSAIFGSNSGKLFKQIDKFWHNDPLAAEKYKQEQLKDTDQVIIGTGSPSTSWSPVAGISADDFTRRDRGSKGDVFMSPAAIAADPVAAEKFFKEHQVGKNTYRALDADQREKAANLLAGTNPTLATKIRSGKATEADMDKAAPDLRKRLEALSNMKWAPQVSTIQESMNYGSYGKGEVGATKMLMAKLPNTMVINPATGEKMSGKDFLEKVYGPARLAAKNTGVEADLRVDGQVSPFNHYGLAHGDNRFGDAMQVTLGGNTYVVGGLDQKKTHLVKDKYGRSASYLEDISGPRNFINQIATETVSKLGAPVQVLPGKGAPTFTIKLNDNGTYTFPQQKGADGKALTVDNPTDIIQAALDHYQEQQAQAASVPKKR